MGRSSGGPELEFGFATRLEPRIGRVSGTVPAQQLQAGYLMVTRVQFLEQGGRGQPACAQVESEVD